MTPQPATFRIVREMIDPFRENLPPEATADFKRVDGLIDIYEASVWGVDATGPCAPTIHVDASGCRIDWNPL